MTPDLQMDDGIGLLVSQAAGPDYQTRCNEYVDEHGRLNVSVLHHLTFTFTNKVWTRNQVPLAGPEGHPSRTNLFTPPPPLPNISGKS